MGAQAWFYFVPYESDLTKSLDALRRREFQAGRYTPVQGFPRFPADPQHRPGAQHASIEAARAAAGASGTRSILDMTRISARPDFGAVTPLGDDELLDLFGTARPTHDDVEDSDDLFEEIERGQGVCLVVYENEKPSEIYFAGYSYD
jgi:hypothetical protein